MTNPSISGTPQAFGFADTPHLVTYTGGGATGSDVVDVLFVVSDATVALPSGFTQDATRVSNAGSYVFQKAGGSTTATIVPGAATNTEVLWLRVANTAGLDSGATAVAGLDSSAGSSSPALTSGSLAEATEGALVFAALHSQAGGLPTGFAWSTGYTEILHGTQGGAATSGVTASVAFKVPAGTAAESPSVTWTGPTFERYLLAVFFKASATVTPPPDVPVAPTSSSLGSWWGLKAAQAENREYARQQRTQEPLSCPNDGEPLQRGTDGKLRCRYDGWMPRGFGQR